MNNCEMAIEKLEEMIMDIRDNKYEISSIDYNREVTDATSRHGSTIEPRGLFRITLNCVDSGIL